MPSSESAARATTERRVGAGVARRWAGAAAQEAASLAGAEDIRRELEHCVHGARDRRPMGLLWG